MIRIEHHPRFIDGQTSLIRRKPELTPNFMVTSSMQLAAALDLRSLSYL